MSYIPSSGTYNAAAVAVTGGSINNTSIGATTASTGAFSAATGPTRTAGDSTTNFATTTFAQNLSNGIAALTSTGGSQTLTASQYGCGILSLTGTLTSNATLAVPVAGQWIVANGTTGAFTVTIKTAAGTGLTVTQGAKAQVYADGTNVVPAVNVNASYMLEWTGGAIVANGTYWYALVAPYNGTILSADYATAGSTSFVANVQIGGVSVTSLSAITVNSATPANSVATGANAFVAGQTITLVITSATSSPTNAAFSLRITRG